MVVEIPKEWKPAGAGEEELDYILYDLVPSGTTPSAKLTFFNNDEASNGIQVTNLPMSGQLPSTQRFLVKEIRVVIDPEAVVGDRLDVLDAAVIDLKVNNERKFSCFAVEALGNFAFLPSGVTSTVEGVQGKPFELDKGIIIDGGVPFSVEFTVGKTAASASTDIYVMLRGRLVRKD